MIYVYSRRPSDSARELVNAFNGIRLRKFDGMNFWRKRAKFKMGEGDILICWGDPVPDIKGVKILNGADVGNKFEVAMKLSQKVPTISVHAGPNPPITIEAARWIPRKNNHVGGNDLLTRTEHPDFWVYKMNIVEEYRVHSFNQKSIRAGVKRLRENFVIDDTLPAGSVRPDGTFAASSWIRSYDGGWRIVYDNFQSTKAMRTAAHEAVKALGLTFGAVDIGKLKDGSFVVLEVNRAPGLEGGTITAYVKEIQRWIDEARGSRTGDSESKELLLDRRELEGDEGDAVNDPVQQPVLGEQAARVDPAPAGAPNAEAVYRIHAGAQERWFQVGQLDDLGPPRRRVQVLGPAIIDEWLDRVINNPPQVAAAVGQGNPAAPNAAAGVHVEAPEHNAPPRVPRPARPGRAVRVRPAAGPFPE